MTTGLGVFDTTVQETNGWLKSLEQKLGHCDREQAYRALRAVLHILRDRLPESAVLGLSAQLPLLLRGVFVEGWRPQDGPAKLDDPEAFTAEVERRLPGFPSDSILVSTAVLEVLAEHLDPGEVDKVIRLLPARLRSLWPEEYWIG